MRPRTNALREKGGGSISFALALMIFIGIAALAVDMGMVYQAKRELQIAADASAMAGVRELAIDDRANARVKAAQVATANKAAGSTIQIDPTTDIQFGSWMSPSFQSGGVPTNAMRVTLRRATNTPQGAVDLAFGRALGLPTADISATGIAVLAAVDLVIVLDTSSSMLFNTSQTGCTRTLNFGASGGVRCVCWPTKPASGYQPWDTLVAAAENFVEDFNSITDQLAVEAFANTGANPLNRTLTAELANVDRTITALPAPLSCATAPSRSTNIGAGLQYAIAELRGARARASAVKMIVLVSDGEPNCPSATGTCSVSSSSIAAAKTYVEQQAAAAASRGIVIHAISLGTLSDRALMARIANATGGSEFYASTASALDDVFAEVRKRVPVQLVN